MSEEKKERLKEYQRNYRGAKKMNINFFWLFWLHNIKMEKKNYLRKRSIISINEVDIESIG